MTVAVIMPRAEGAAIVGDFGENEVGGIHLPDAKSTLAHPHCVAHYSPSAATATGNESSGVQLVMPCTVGKGLSGEEQLRFGQVVASRSARPRMRQEPFPQSQWGWGPRDRWRLRVFGRAGRDMDRYASRVL